MEKICVIGVNVGNALDDEIRKKDASMDEEMNIESQDMGCKTSLNRSPNNQHGSNELKY